jgi:hypothetical protein
MKNLNCLLFISLLLFTYSIKLIKIELPTPKYLRVANWRDCLSFQLVGNYKEYCLPSSILKECDENSWEDLTSLNSELKSCINNHI